MSRENSPCYLPQRNINAARYGTAALPQNIQHNEYTGRYIIYVAVLSFSHKFPSQFFSFGHFLRKKRHRNSQTQPFMLQGWPPEEWWNLACSAISWGDAGQLTFA